MSAVTIGKSYFEALLRRAEFYTSAQDLHLCVDLSNNVTISKAEHDFMLQAVREYRLLKSALFRGGLTTETLETLVAGEDRATIESSPYDYASGGSFSKTPDRPASVRKSFGIETSPHSESAVGIERSLPSGSPHAVSYDEPESSVESPYRGGTRAQRVPVHDQRTILVTNLHERTSHKDLTGIVRGGRLLDIFLRNDRSAVISFVEGAAEFLAYAKRTDIYLHTKRLEFRWSDRHFHVPPHVANKIASGATRNIVVRGVASKLTKEEIRDHLDHIHNLVVVDISFQNGDAYISTNSVHNALFARTCMMSRTAYKGARVEHYADECAEPVPRPEMKFRSPIQRVAVKAMPIVNPYALLGTGSDDESDNDDASYPNNGVRVDSQHWSSVMV